MKIFLINKNDSDQRIDKFLSKSMPKLPKSMMYKLFRKKDIKINGKPCNISTVLNEGDTVTVYVKDELCGRKAHDISFMSLPKDIDIVYEDCNIIIVNKPKGLDSHTGSGKTNDCLVNRIKHYLYDKKEYIPENESSFAPAICSRLDRNTAGLVISAKNASSLREINSAIRDGYIRKIYRCVCISPLPKTKDILTAYHKKEGSDNIALISDHFIDGYKEIKTGYKSLKTRGELTLAEITLFTGRTHQIRAHLSHIGSPILGDGKYGNVKVNKKYGEFSQLLCAYSLSFDFPKDSPMSYLNDISVKTKAPSFEKKYFSE